MKPINRTTLHTENSKRRGISPAVAAIILIVAAVVIGVLVVVYAMGLFKSTTTAPQIVIRNIDLYCNGTGYSLYVTLEVLKGSISATNLRAEIYSGGSKIAELTTSLSKTINPGETVTVVLSSSNPAEKCHVSSAYTVMIYYGGQRIYSGQIVAESLGG